MCSIEVSMSMSMVRYGESIAMVVASWCAKEYGMDEVDVMGRLSRELNIKINNKKEKVIKEKKELSVKSAFPLPFNGEHDESKCQALRQNNGLYTQCQSVRKDGNAFCKSCKSLAEKSSDGIPEYGTIMQRMAVSPFEYKDPKGRKPTAYTKVMKKYNVSIEEVKEEASKFGMSILEEHFVSSTESKRGRPATKAKSVKETKGVKGRPKKEKKVLQIEDEEDLFASLVANANAEDDESIMSDLSEKTGKESQKSEAKEAAKTAEKLAKEQEKAEKAAKLEAEKQAKAAEKAAKEAEKAAAKEQKNKKPVAVDEEEEEEEETYRKCSDTSGKKYIRSEQTNIVYDLEIYNERQELCPVGKWVGGLVIIHNNQDSESELSDEEVDE